MARDDLKMSATNFGFDPTWITDILSKYGDQVLALIVEAARQGFSVSLITEIVQKFGPSLLQLLMEVFNHKNAMRRHLGEAPGDIIIGPINEGDNIVVPMDASLLDVLIVKYLPILIQTYMPAVWASVGPQIVKFVQDNLQTILDKYGPQIMQFVQANLQPLLNTYGPQIIQAILQLFLTNVTQKKQ